MELNYTIEIPDVSDGGVIASAVSGYVNSYATPGRHFYECMLERDTDVQHNFTMLCIEWFKQLANVSMRSIRRAATKIRCWRHPQRQQICRTSSGFCVPCIPASRR